MPEIISALILFGFGAFVFLRNPKSIVNISLALLCLSCFVWLASFSFMFLSTLRDRAYMWAISGYSGIMYIPSTLYHFSFSVLGIKDKRKLKILSVYLISTFFLIVLLSTPLVIKDVYRYFWGFYPRAGILHPLYLIFFTYLFLKCLWLFYHEYMDRKRKKIAIAFNQIRYVSLGFIIAFLGSVDYIPNYGLEIYPFGNLCASLCVGILVFAIVKYHLMDIRVAITRGVIFVFVYGIILLTPFLVGYKLLGKGLWYIPLLLGIILASGGPFIYTIIRKRAEDVLLAQQKKYQNTLIQASKGMTLIKELDKLLNVIIRVMSKAIGVSHAYIYLRNPEADEYNLRAKRNRQNISNLPAGKIQSNIPLIKWLKGHRDILIYDEAALMPEGKNIAKNMKDMQADIIIPSFIQNELIGFLAMGKKLSGDMYTSDDLAVFQVLANQAALAIENAIFYEETGKSLAQQFHEHRLRSIGQMGSMMGHQINNRFQAIWAKAEEALDIMQDGMKKVSLSNENKTFLVRAEKAMKSIAENANLGGNITKHLTVFSRKETKYKLVDLDEVITATIELLSYKFDITELNLKTDVEKTPLKIKGDMAQLQDIFFNLLDNAHDAEQQKKQNQKDYIPETKIKAFTDNNLWRIELSDNGIGMTKEESDQLFLPFFTTKATTEKGTGIGSSVIKAMIENHKGTIDVESEYGKGTYFKITLPAI